MHKNGVLLAAPVLIYDDKCSSCTRFAKISAWLSRGRVRAVGHYTAEGARIKNRVFQARFDAECMFWLVATNGAFGGRSGLLPLAREIAKGFLGIGEKIGASVENETVNDFCGTENPSCGTPRGFLSRLAGLLRNGQKIERASG